MTTVAAAKVSDAEAALTIYLPDTRGVAISRWGKGNLKLGTDGVYTYSRLPGRPDGHYEALAQERGFAPDSSTGTCPGSSQECESICYAKRVIGSPVWDVWATNSATETLPAVPLPEDAKMVRIHVSGDFTSIDYIERWVTLIRRNPDVLFWAYTRSWRVPHLLPVLEKLRAMPNMQLFASMDKSITEWPPMGWRRAWIEDDPRANWKLRGEHNRMTEDAKNTYICPEEVGRQPNCQACGYCLRGRAGDVTFLLH